MEKRKPEWVCRWEGCYSNRLGALSLCSKHMNKARGEFATEYKKSRHGTTVCVMPGCGKTLSELPHLHLCNAHLAIVAQQVHAAQTPEAPLLAEVTTEEDWLVEHERKRLTVKPPRARKSVVYYVQVGAHIKIGWTSDLQSRMRDYPPNSVLLAVHPGSRADEARLHKRFAHHRTHGREWYAPVPSVLHHIAQVKAEHGEPETVTFGAQPVTIPEPRPTQYVAMRSRSGASYPRASA